MPVIIRHRIYELEYLAIGPVLARYAVNDPVLRLTVATAPTAENVTEDQHRTALEGRSGACRTLESMASPTNPFPFVS